MSIFKTVSEIETALRNREFADGILAQVDKGKKGTFTYIPWNYTVRALTEVFGTFGWSAKITNSFSDTARGIYIVDLELTVTAVDDENGSWVTKTLPGRGMGIVSASQLENGDAHDTAGKAARSDAISVAAKSLGDAFGLFLYDKGDPARATTTATSSRNEASTTATATPAADGSIGAASVKQVPILKKNGWTDAQIAALGKDELRKVMDGIFGKSEKILPPKTATGASLTIVRPTGTDGDDF